MSLSHSCPHWFFTSQVVQKFLQKRTCHIPNPAAPAVGLKTFITKSLESTNGLLPPGGSKKETYCQRGKGVLNLCRRWFWQEICVSSPPCRLGVCRHGGVHSNEVLTVQDLSALETSWRGTAPTIWQSLEENWDILDIRYYWIKVNETWLVSTEWGTSSRQVYKGINTEKLYHAVKSGV